MAYDLSWMKIVDDSHRQNLDMVGTLPPNYQRQGMLFHATACRNVGDSSLLYLLSKHNPISSADQLIDRDGTIHQLVPVGHYAYHSGPAVWEGFHDEEGGLNMAYYGIEIENTNDGREAYTEKQVKAAAATYAYKCALHRWPNDRRMAKHYEVAIETIVLANGQHRTVYGRKTDPYKFPWRFFYDELRAIRADWPRDRFGIDLWVPVGR